MTEGSNIPKVAGRPGIADGIEATNLVKRYRRRTVVKGVSLTVRRGEVVGLLGPNGAGKTTTFYMIVGLEAADSGRIFIDGEDVTHLPVHLRARRGLGYLAQEASIFRKLTVLENIEAILELRGMRRPATREKAMELLERFDIAHLAGQMGYTLSGGERRRVEIARCLAVSPSFILLDEPFTGVDPIAVQDIQGIITMLRQDGLGILITDHSVRETLAIVDRAYIMHQGEILVSGRSQEVAESPVARKFYLGERFRM
ncbi:MAG TPA: LPS export ABC transporter ATP-binding protein [Firmicutes bacterium]|nr:LPS export ABC transporter ATP-binding protein [Bacillota bacterium]